MCVPGVCTTLLCVRGSNFGGSRVDAVQPIQLAITGTHTVSSFSASGKSGTGDTLATSCIICERDPFPEWPLDLTELIGFPRP